MRLLTFILCGAFFGLAAIAAAASDATQSSRRPATTQLGDLSSPRSMMLSYDSLAGAAPEAFAPFFVAHGADEERLVRAEARIDAMLGMLQVIIEKKWGMDGVDTVLHAFGSKTRSDIQSAKIKIDGDHAQMIWTDDAPPVGLIRTDDGWKIDAADMKKSIGEPVDEYVTSMQSLSPVVSDVADAIADGKLKTPAETAAEVERRMKSQ